LGVVSHFEECNNYWLACSYLGWCFQVAAMWVLDLDQYNEWMTEEDYEVDEGGHKKIHKVGRAD